MSRARRTPPLFEAVGDANRSPSGETPARPLVHPAGRSPAAAGVPAPKSPVVVTAPHSAPRGPLGLDRSRLTPLLLMAAAAAILIGFVAWSVGYSRGEDAGKRSMVPRTTPDDAAAFTGEAGPSTVLPPGNATRPPEVRQPTPKAPDAKPPANPPVAAGMPPVTGPDPRQPGNNYLEIVRLTWRDAEAAVRYLQKNGVPATCIPLSRVDPAQAQANNALHLVFVLDGVPSNQYKASEDKRSTLKASVQRIGKKWQREERGASDFGDPNWVLFKGN